MDLLMCKPPSTDITQKYITKWYITVLLLVTLTRCAVDAGPLLTGCPSECVCSSRENVKVQDQHQLALCSNMPTSDLAPTINTLQITGAELGNITADNVAHNFHYLTSLDITSCGVTGIEPGALDDAPQILSLSLSHNRIVELELGTFAKCGKLRKLYLDHNNLETLDDGVFSKLDSLEYLNLRGNKLTYVPSKLPPKLREIDLSDNNIGPSVNPLLHQVYLKNLNLCGNPLKELPSTMFDNMKNLQVLCVGTPLPEGTYRKLVHLTNLTLVSQDKTGNTQMDETTIQEISLMESSLRTLSICYFVVPDLTFLNNLKLLHLALQHVSSRKSIDIETAFQHKEYLQTLILESSQQLYSDFIANSKVIKGLKNLNELRLVDNNIFTLTHASVPDNRHLRIDIHHNPLQCDCQLAWITHRVLLHNDDTYCSNPPSVKGKLLAKVINEMDCPGMEHFTTSSSNDSEHSGYKDDTSEETDHSTLYIILGSILGILLIAGIVLAIVYKRYKKSGSSTITSEQEIEESQLKNIKQSTSSKDHLLKN